MVEFAICVSVLHMRQTIFIVLSKTCMHFDCAIFFELLL